VELVGILDNLIVRGLDLRAPLESYSEDFTDNTLNFNIESLIFDALEWLVAVLL
jgi:hypothetical protein